MISILFIILILLAGYFLSDKIEKYKYFQYGVFTVLGVLSVVLEMFQ